MSLNVSMQVNDNCGVRDWHTFQLVCTLTWGLKKWQETNEKLCIFQLVWNSVEYELHGVFRLNWPESICILVFLGPGLNISHIEKCATWLCKSSHSDVLLKCYRPSRTRVDKKVDCVQHADLDSWANVVVVHISMSCTFQNTSTYSFYVCSTRLINLIPWYY